MSSACLTTDNIYYTGTDYQYTFDYNSTSMTSTTKRSRSNTFTPMSLFLNTVHSESEHGMNGNFEIIDIACGYYPWNTDEDDYGDYMIWLEKNNGLVVMGTNRNGNLGLTTTENPLFGVIVPNVPSTNLTKLWTFYNKTYIATDTGEIYCSGSSPLGNETTGNTLGFTKMNLTYGEKPSISYIISLDSVYSLLSLNRLKN